MMSKVGSKFNFMSLTEISPLESSKITFKSIDFTFSGGEAITLPDLGSY